MLRFYLKKRLVAGKKSFALELEYALGDGAFLGVRGPSGSGKSTLIRCLAGLEMPDEGFIRIGDTVWYDARRRIFAPARKRRIGVVFQDYALFPNMTMLGNVMFARADESRARELLELMRLAENANQFPRELSGGQKQRTALARALIHDPELLLLDEPLSSLDEELRESLGDELVRIQRATGITAVMVSHSGTETRRLSTEVLELRSGRLNDEKLSVY